MNHASTSTDTAKGSNLTRFEPGSVKELSTIVWPLVLSFFSMSLMALFNRFFLSHYSVEALESSVSAMQLAFLFQVPLMRISSIAQIFVARYIGAKEETQVGSVVWQMIWLSFLSLFLTLPLGLGIGSIFFKGTIVEKLGFPYFSLLMLFNFIFPLGSALSAFFTGRGCTKTITLSLGFAHIVQIGLDKILIFGIPGFLSPLGAMGAAISTVCSQFLYCIILFLLFLSRENQATYATQKWKLKPTLLKECAWLGLPRAIAKLLILAAWTGSMAILTQKGGDYLLAFTLGTSFYAFFSCLNEGLGQGLITVASYYLGKKQTSYLFPVAKASFTLLGGIAVFLSFFLIFFPRLFITTFFPHAISSEQMSMLTYSCYGLWFFLICDGLSWIGFGFINALKEMKFYLIYTALTVYFFNYLPTYFAYQWSHLGVEWLWWMMALPCLASSIAYYFRILKAVDLSRQDRAPSV